MPCVHTSPKHTTSTVLQCSKLTATLWLMEHLLPIIRLSFYVEMVQLQLLHSEKKTENQ